RRDGRWSPGRKTPHNGRSAAWRPVYRGPQAPARPRNPDNGRREPWAALSRLKLRTGRTGGYHVQAVDRDRGRRLHRRRHHHFDRTERTGQRRGAAGGQERAAAGLRPARLALQQLRRHALRQTERAAGDDRTLRPVGCCPAPRPRARLSFGPAREDDMRRVIFAVLALTCATPAPAQDYPNRPVRIIVPTPAGGPVDVMARLLANALPETLKQSVFIENKP